MFELPNPFHLLFAGHLYELRLCLELRMLLYVFNHWGVVLVGARDLQEFLHLALVECAFIALFLKVWVYDSSTDGASFCAFFEMGTLHIILVVSES